MRRPRRLGAMTELTTRPRGSAAPLALAEATAARKGLNTGQEFSFSAADYDRVRELIYQHAGISLHAGKQAMVYSRLSRRLRETGHASFADYLQSLQRGTGAAADAEWQEFVNCLTTNLTAFFREDHHFAALADDLRARPGGPLRIWCSAASTGEEPYSIAMTVIETLGPQAPVRIVASDIDTQVLATAQRGIYDAQARGLSPERLRRHFMRGIGSHAGQVRVRPELTRLIEFRSVNLMSPQWALGEAFDFIFCRNVMIYFDASTQRSVLRQMHGVLRPNGLLYVGHSENFNDVRELFHLRGKTIYQRA